jgi:N-formylglutamate amidohydrolase
MHGAISTAALDDVEFLGIGHDVREPAVRRLPVIVASPHSGDRYPPGFVAGSRLDPKTLRRSEDVHVDSLFAGALDAGAPMLRAHFPRAYLDANREPFELDPAMFDDELPDYVTTRSPRIAAGLGTVPRIVASGHDIYARPLSFEDAAARIRRLHMPYHERLSAMLSETRTRYGVAVLIDAHSMPSSCGPSVWEAPGRLDFVLGDCHGTACDPRLTAAAETMLASLGYAVMRNDPYPGGFTTRHHGRPRQQVHALQIEINRSLYMDEGTFVRSPDFARISTELGQLVSKLGRLALDRLAA